MNNKLLDTRIPISRLTIVQLEMHPTRCSQYLQRMCSTSVAGKKVLLLVMGVIAIFKSFLFDEITFFIHMIAPVKFRRQ